MTRARRTEPSPAETMDIPALIDQRQELLEVLDAQTDAAQAVIGAWERGDLAAAVRMLGASIPPARAAIARTKSPAA